MVALERRRRQQHRADTPDVAAAVVVVQVAHRVDVHPVVRRHHLELVAVVAAAAVAVRLAYQSDSLQSEDDSPADADEKQH